MKIVIASNNLHKIEEIASVLPDHLELLPQNHFDLPSVEETGLTFIENAILKARFASAKTALPSLADDSGLEVDALNGEPGIYSARYAGEDATDTENYQKLLNAMADIELRTARFQSVIVFMKHQNDPTPVIAQGTWQGQILSAPQGDAGFGYDPIFLPDGYDTSVATLPADLKNRISHRGMALQHLKAQLSF